MRKFKSKLKTIGIALAVFFMATPYSYSQDLWNTIKNQKDVLSLSVWFTTQEVDKYLATSGGIDSVVDWCKQYGITKVYTEAFGRGHYAKREILVNAKTRFLAEGLDVASGVTTTKFGKNGADGSGTGWSATQCYTNKGTQEALQRMFEYTAEIFDEIIIDDWYFTQCQCDECIRARGDKSWSKYYTDLMVEVSNERVMKPARAVNPNVKVIIKFPQWNDQFHIRGYDVIRESKIFDGIWAGTEGRNFDYKTTPGYEIGYNAYFNIRWLATLGSVGGGWFDTGGDKTKVTTYLEQARHTVLGEGKKMILWSYSGHVGSTQKMAALAKEFSGLVKLAKIVHHKPIKGVHFFKPGNSDPFEDEWVGSFLGNLGIPLLPVSVVNEDAKSTVFSAQSLKDTNFVNKFQRIVNKGTPLVLTDGFASRFAIHIAFLNNANVTLLPFAGSPNSILSMSREQIRPFRDKLMAPLGIKFDAPNNVELYLFGDNSFVVENINDTAVEVTLDFQRLSNAAKILTLPEDADVSFSNTGNSIRIRIAPNTLVVGEYK